MRFVLALAVVSLLGCRNETTHIPPPPNYILALPEGEEVWVQHVEKGFLAGCEQLGMECQVLRYGDEPAEAVVKAIVAAGDTKGAPVCVATSEPEAVKPLSDALSLGAREGILVGADDTRAYRVGHVGPDAKRLAALVARRSQILEPRAQRILYLIGHSPVDTKMLEAAAFRESNNWQKYRPRVKALADVTDEDFAWCDLVVPIGEDAQARTVESDVERIFPTEPTDESLELLKSGRAPFVIANNYFDIGLRASRIARERALYRNITNPILPIAPKEVDSGSVELYLETRFRVPPIVREKPAPLPPIAPK